MPLELLIMSRAEESPEMKSTSLLDEVCKELDTLTLQTLQLMNQYIRQKMRIEEAIKGGSLELAKARYIMGNKRVSSLQLPTEGSNVSARITVCPVANKNSLGNVTFELQTADQDNNSKESNLRSRMKQNVTGKSETSSGSTKVEAQETQPPEMLVNQEPLKWFGVLVPQNLRNSQALFKNALSPVVECANVQCELEAAQLKFKTLLKKKNKLKSQMSL